MQVNKISNITFKEDEPSKKNISSQNAILMLRDSNASVKFQQNKELAYKADALSSNPLTALGYKLYRTFYLIRNNNNQVETPQKLNTLA